MLDRIISYAAVSCRKRNKPMHLFKTYAPVLVVVELLLLILVAVTMNHSISYGNKRNKDLEARIFSRDTENRNLLVTFTAFTQAIEDPLHAQEFLFWRGVLKSS